MLPAYPILCIIGYWPWFRWNCFVSGSLINQFFCSIRVSSEAQSSEIALVVLELQPLAHLELDWDRKIILHKPPNFCQMLVEFRQCQAWLEWHKKKPDIYIFHLKCWKRPKKFSFADSVGWSFYLVLVWISCLGTLQKSRKYIPYIVCQSNLIGQDGQKLRKIWRWCNNKSCSFFLQFKVHFEIWETAKSFWLLRMGSGILKCLRIFCIGNNGIVKLPYGFFVSHKEE